MTSQDGELAAVAGEHPEHPVRLRGTLLLSLGALSAFGPMSLDLYLPAFPSIASTLRVSTGDVQLTFSACLIGLGLGQLVYGPLSDRFGRKPPLVAGLLLYVVAAVLCAVAPTLAMLTVARLLMGLGGCAGLVISRAIVRDCFEGPALARSFSVISSVSMLAPLVAPALGAAVLHVASWRAMFLVMAAFGVCCLLAALLLPETHPSHHRTEHGVLDSLRGYRSLLEQRLFVLPASIFAVAGGILLTYISSSSIVFMGGYGVSATGFALVFALMALCFIGGLRLNMRLVLSHPTHVLIRVYLGVAVPALVLLVALLAAHAPVWAVLGALGVVKACLGGTFPNASAETMQPFARTAGSASALLGTMQFAFAGVVGAMLSTLAFTPSLEMSVTMLVLAVLASALAALRR